MCEYFSHVLLKKQRAFHRQSAKPHCLKYTPYDVNYIHIAACTRSKTNLPASHRSEIRTDSTSSARKTQTGSA